MKFWKWTHKWFSVVFGLLVILWALSGILLNHRNLISTAEVNRALLPPSYQYKNWNNAAVRSGLEIGNDSILIYGNIGICLTNRKLVRFSPFISGFPKGIDGKKVNQVFQSQHGIVYAATQSGLYELDRAGSRWIKIPLDLHDERIMDVTQKGDRLVFLTRSELIIGYDKPQNASFERFVLPRAVDDDGLVGLFRTLWVLHSGEIYGVVGKLIVDLFAIALLFLVITGYIYFFFPRWIKKLKRKGKTNRSLMFPLSFSIKWHNKVGIYIAVFLVFTTITGMFLRPPLLIAIGNKRVEKIPFSLLSNANPWFDRLRAIHWNEAEKYWLIGTNEGFYKANENFQGQLMPFAKQPPVSVMGINAFEFLGNDTYLVGSFNGLFWWQPNAGYIRDAITGKMPEQTTSAGSPLGEYLIAGMMQVEGKRLVFDYNRGLLEENISMPLQIREGKMSLWNVALEVHAGRIFQDVLGPFYILLVPLFGLIMLFILLGGLVRWFKIRKRKSNNTPLIDH